MRVKEYKSQAGLTILIGQDDTSNDDLTFGVGKPKDLWFHVSGAAGSHVLLQASAGDDSPDKESIREAAELAAWYSKMRSGGRVAVKYCPIENVRKTKNAKPGTVQIRKEKTIKVRPKNPEAAST